MGKTVAGLISVIIPCYNQGKYVKEAITSVLDQTYDNVEIIVINDGSTDKFTNEVLGRMSLPKTKVYRTSNQGLAKTRNFGFNKAIGEFIQFLDADDLLEKDKFAEQIAVFKRSPATDICYSSYKYYHEDNNIYRDHDLPVELSHNPLSDFVYGWQRYISIPIHCGLFRKRVWAEKEPFINNFKAIEDWLMWIDLANRNCKFKFIDNDFAIYRVHNKNMTTNRTFMFYWVTRAISFIAEKYITPQEEDKFEQASQKYLRNLIDIYFLNNLVKPEKQNLELNELKFILDEVSLSKSAIFKSLRAQIEMLKKYIESDKMLNSSLENQLELKTEEVNKLLNQVKDLSEGLEKEKKARGEEVEKLTLETQILKGERDNLVNSKDYRVGSKLLDLPRRIKRMIK